MNKQELIKAFRKLWYEVHNCTEENPCCVNEDEHNRKVGKLCGISIRLQELGVNVDKLILQLRAFND